MAAKDIRPRITDAVVVVPGIMGSELVDADGKIRWGLKPSLLANAWVTGNLEALHVTEADIAGGGRLRPTRLLRDAGYMPLLGGVEPYTYLLGQLTERAVDSRAVAEFPYDWRLSIAHNASLLVARCEQHLADWRRIVAEKRYGDPAEARVVIVAHSMGGLVTRYAAIELGLAPLLAQIITLGTPYYGSVKAVQMLATGAGAPPVIPQSAARGLSLTSPGVHDLLPRYRCWDDGTGIRRIATADLTRLGARGDLADDAQARWQKLLLDQAAPAVPAPLHALAGTDQPTRQSVRSAGGSSEFLDSLAGVDHGGDSTVYRGAAAPAGTIALPLPQKHGALARTKEAVSIVLDKLVGADAGPPLGTRELGADIPDLIEAGQPVQIRATIEDGSPIGVSVTSTALDTGVPTTWQTGVAIDGDIVFSRAGLTAGLHRVQVKAGGYSGVSEIMLVVPRS